jgi:hypothetical protein
VAARGERAAADRAGAAHRRAQRVFPSAAASSVVRMRPAGAATGAKAEEKPHVGTLRPLANADEVIE